ncbi:hypothetical protein BpHYR1_026662 [Brachionus plicatilis]|uniref:Uncharacterized protein n=1 Tax=Brachionus plicatilis TaxID=10195 RepID=A0A3M7RV10_BRAPC|nr:hypothetical protein BpHYR1_026662 [Brachionus plicatilis]
MAVKGTSRATVATCDAWLHELHLRIVELETKCAAKDILIQDLRTELNEVKGNASCGPTVSWISKVNGNKPNDQTQALIASVSKEFSEKSRIENNVIVSAAGIGTEEEYKKKVSKILETLNIDRSKLKSHGRIKNTRRDDTGEDARRALDMIVVEFKDEDTKQKKLRNARNLRDTDNFKSVYINPDRKPSERALDRQLSEGDAGGRHRYGVQSAGHHKAGKKFYWGIRSNELREIYLN